MNHRDPETQRKNLLKTLCLCASVVKTYLAEDGLSMLGNLKND